MDEFVFVREELIIDKGFKIFFLYYFVDLVLLFCCFNILLVNEYIWIII